MKTKKPLCQAINTKGKKCIVPAVPGSKFSPSYRQVPRLAPTGFRHKKK